MKGKELDFSKHLFIIRNLIQKLRAFEQVCGSGLIHDVRLHLNILVNWERNLEFYSTYGGIFEMIDWKVPGGQKKFEPTQDYVDGYFLGLCGNAERFLEENVKWS